MDARPPRTQRLATMVGRSRAPPRPLRSGNPRTQPVATMFGRFRAAPRPLGQGKAAIASSKQRSLLTPQGNVPTFARFRCAAIDLSEKRTLLAFGGCARVGLRHWSASWAYLHCSRRMCISITRCWLVNVSLLPADHGIGCL